MSDFEILGKDEKIRKKVLHTLATDVNMGLDIEMEARILECIECRSPFSLSAIKSGRFIVDTMTCRTCYKNLQRSADSCFGKTKNSEHEGYSEADIECQLHCKDRKICADFIQNRKGNIMAKNGTAVAKAKAAPEVDDLDELDEVEVAPKKGKTKAVAAEPVKKAKTKVVAEEAEEEEAPAKKAKTGKAEVKPAKVKKVKADKPEEDEGPDLPWKKKSMMRYLLGLCMAEEGATEKQLEKVCVEYGVSWPLQRRALLTGKNGKANVSDPTHTWSIDAEGGTLKVTNVKRVKK